MNNCILPIIYLLGLLTPFHTNAQDYYRPGTDTLLAGVHVNINFEKVCKEKFPYLVVTIRMKNDNNLDVIITNPLFEPERCLKFVEKTLNHKDVSFDYRSDAFYCGKSIGPVNNSYPYRADSLFVEGEKHINTPLLRGYSKMENIIIMEGDEMIFYLGLPLIMPGIYSFQYDFAFDVETASETQVIRTEVYKVTTW